MTSAYQQQLTQQLQAAEDELAQWRTYGRRTERYRAAWLSARRRAVDSCSGHDTYEAAAQRWANDLARLGHDQLKRAEQAATERDGAYRERAHLTAWLATIHPAVITPAVDIDEDGWQILYLTVGGRQLSWHIHPRDTDLYAHVEHVPADDPRAQWDGHTTDEKYQAIREMTFSELRGNSPFAVTVTPGVAQTPWGVIVPTAAEDQAPRACEPDCDADHTDPDHIHDPECGSTNAAGVRRCTRPADHNGHHLNDDGHDWDDY
jgi:hypothetical protein